MKYVFWYTIAGMITAGLAGITYWLFRFKVATAVAAAPLALIINGWVAEREDNLPGGFNNPTGDDAVLNEKAYRFRRRFYTLIGILLCLCAAIAVLMRIYVKPE